MLSSIRNAVKDLSETIVRAFFGATTHRASQCFIAEPECNSMEKLFASVSSAALISQPSVNSVALLKWASAKAPVIKFDAITQWNTLDEFNLSPKRCDVCFFWPCTTASAKIPEMNEPSAFIIDRSIFNFKTEKQAIAQFEILAKTHESAECFIAPKCVQSIERALMESIIIKSQDIAGVPKALWMRYTMLLVKKTGENVKNLQIIGIYKIPKNGVKKISHSASRGIIRIHVGSEAIDAQDCTLVIAKKKSDDTIMSYTI